MSENRKTRGAAALLILLATASFAVAAVTITNITEWVVRAYTAPIVKVKGDDIITSDYFYTGVSSVVYAEDGTNRTRITLTGFVGDTTRYTSVLKICNKDTQMSYNVRLVYKEAKSSLQGYKAWEFVSYVTLSLGEFTIKIDSTATEGLSTGWFELSQAQKVGDKVKPTCVDVGAEILVRAKGAETGDPTPTERDLIEIIVDVESQPLTSEG